jgi:hypothetical protein
MNLLRVSKNVQGKNKHDFMKQKMETFPTTELAHA